LDDEFDSSSESELDEEDEPDSDELDSWSLEPLADPDELFDDAEDEREDAAGDSN
jgi:hypothetical protein